MVKVQGLFRCIWIILNSVHFKKNEAIKRISKESNAYTQLWRNRQNF